MPASVMTPTPLATCPLRTGSTVLHRAAPQSDTAAADTAGDYCARPARDAWKSPHRYEARGRASQRLACTRPAVPQGSSRVGTGGRRRAGGHRVPTPSHRDLRRWLLLARMSPALPGSNEQSGLLGGQDGQKPPPRRACAGGARSFGLACRAHLGARPARSRSWPRRGGSVRRRD